MQLWFGQDMPAEEKPFQYPRSDRAGCNMLTNCSIQYKIPSFSILGRIERDATRLTLPKIGEIAALSVSSVGSSGMQPRSGHSCDGRGFSFQYPRSDRAGCNPPGRWLAPIEVVLSVSSVGSSGMQLDIGQLFRGLRPDFQYPRSDRAGCNPRHKADPLVMASLSVSSVGSSGMQLPAGPPQVMS